MSASTRGAFRRALLFVVLLGIVSSTLTLGACDRLPGFEDKDATATAEAKADRTPEARPTADRVIVRSVTADGHLVLPMEPLQLGFSTGGTVEEILVEVGDSVFQSRPLAVIETASLDLAVANARTAVVQAENAIARLGDGSQAETARLQVEQAKNQLWGAQAQRDATCGGYERGQKEGGAAKAMAPTSAQCDSAQANVQAMEQGVQLAQENQRAIGASQSGESTAAQLQLQSARMSLGQALDNVERATLTAPVTGTIAAVHLLPGLDAGPGVPVLTLDPEGWLEFVTTNLGERYVGDIEVGAPVDITFTAYPDRVVEGTVVRVADRGTQDMSGAVVFSVYIELAPNDLSLRAGLTGRAEIKVVEDVEAEEEAGADTKTDGAEEGDTEDDGAKDDESGSNHEDEGGDQDDEGGEGGDQDGDQDGEGSDPF